jgi:type II secretory ATPase GspE/PulE/Tfp pilus assembly ATPase PilB-like protein
MSYTIQYLESEMAAQGVEVIVLVNCLVQDAIRLGASDLHIEPWEEAVAVRARHSSASNVTIGTSGCQMLWQNRTH